MAGFPLPTTKGRLLVAAPPLGDPNFDRTVVYMLEHNEHGALGVVVNRVSVSVDDAFENWVSLLAPPATVFAGGPVQPEAFIALSRNVDDEVEPVELDRDPLLLDPTPRGVRIFHGNAGWGAQQLDGELEAGVWIVAAATIDDVFTDRPDSLWSDVMSRQPGRVAWMAAVPSDLSLN
jgi:putative transcriptional regulator